MTKSITVGYTDTAIAGNPAMQVTVGKLNYGTDFRKSAVSASEVVATNVTCPVDQPETLRISQKPISNVYANLDVDPSGYLPSKKGIATLLEDRQLWVETDSVDATYKKYIPIKVGITIQAPQYSGVTSTLVQTACLRAFSLILEQGVVDTTGMDALLRGVLSKKDMK